jgi:tetratricopeptide (TPR) repeat protein
LIVGPLDAHRSDANLLLLRFDTCLPRESETLLTFSGRGDEAVASFNEALRLSPHDQFNFYWHYLMGFALFTAGRYQEALESTEKALRENSNFQASIGFALHV